MNFGTPVPLIVGVVLIVGAIVLFFLGKIKPGYQRDSDTVYAFLALICGVILLGHLGLDFILSLQQMLMVGMLIALLLENVQNRTPNAGQMKQAHGGNFRPEPDRPSRTYRADVEPEPYMAMDERPNRRKMREGRRGEELDDRPTGRRSEGPRSEGNRFLEDRPRRRSRYDEDVPPDSPRSFRDDSFADEPRSIPSRSGAGNRRDRGDDFGGQPSDRPNSGPNSGLSNEFDAVPKPRRRRPPEEEDSGSRRPNRDSSGFSAKGGDDYVDYRPIEPQPPKESWGPSGDS
ncbi:MAG: Ycf66 family protein [Synechococcales bacterium]|nr:Ycf66 family protein [Synechococcales bacterium]